eukprot:TRINITY_DN22757_c0_g1_i1.p1 TRINITY_DN22757_c0_g1~~TRINITY_DN22757_c0_g1_i1.p1  ORF type:complete len:533 (+),score=193.48 TRINITY_DN22757_c0_g1_i1:48-1646(+)
MVVLAAAVLTNATANKSPKVILARQYVEMSRIRIEGLLAALPRLMSSGSQHTFIETESVRYLYQPFEGMLLTVVTNKGSNIVDDLDTLRMLGRVMNDLVPPSQDLGAGSARTEVEVSSVAYEIMFAMDELLSIGYRNHVTVEGVHTALSMKSQEEDHAKEIEIKKVKDAKAKARQEAKRINKLKTDNEEVYDAPQDMGEPEIVSPTHEEVAAPVAPTAAAPVRKTGTGMKMGVKKKRDTAAAVLAEDGVKAAAGAAAPGAPVSAVARRKGGVSDTAEAVVVVKEQITVGYDSEGNVVEAPKVKGSLSLTVPSPEYGYFEVQFDRKTLQKRTFDFRPHPKLDAKTFDGPTCLLRSKPDNKAAFPAGQPMQILKWGVKAGGGSLDVPLTVSIWGDDENILVQYELNDESRTYVNAVITLPAVADPVVEEADECENTGSHLVWNIGTINADRPQASINITMNHAVPVTQLEPIMIDFQSPMPLAGVRVADVLPVGSNALWYRRRMAVCMSARRSSALGRISKEAPEALANIVEFL